MRIGYELKMRRRRTGQTDYRMRLKLLLSKKPRLAVRKSLKHIRVQVISYTQKGDVINASAFSQELKKFGWNYSTSSLPAAYLTGLLCGIRAKENLMTFLKSVALYHGRSVVVREDYDELLRLYRFMNFSFRQINGTSKALSKVKCNSIQEKKGET